MDSKTTPPKTARPALITIARYLLLVILFSLIYFVVAKASLSLAFLNKSAAPIWPPTGLSLAALILAGYRFWPGIFVGAFLTNLFTTNAALSSLGIAAGNTIEALVGSYLVIKYCGAKQVFERGLNVANFCLIAAPLSAAISASIGVISLYLDGLTTSADWFMVWLTWFLGDMGGALTFTPVLVLWGKDSHRGLNGRSMVEAILLGCCLVLVIATVFDGLFPRLSENHYPIAFLCFPVILWASYRFGPRASSLVIMILSVFAIIGTLAGHGPYVTATPNESLLLLQCFLGAVTMTGMILSASVLERDLATIELTAREHELQEVDRRKDQFLAVLGHELRNPLAAISSALQLARQAPQKLPIEKLQEMAEKHIRQLGRLIDDLLDIARINHGKFNLQKKLVNLNQIISDAVESTQELVAKRGHTLTLDVAESFLIEVDATRIEQILVNLLNNAAKYTEQGGTIHVRSYCEGSAIKISVKDSGVGIAPQMLDSIFDPFTQAENTLHRKNAGIGIGLTLVQQLADMHGGSVIAQSEGLGYGSEFVLSLPMLTGDRSFITRTECSPMRQNLRNILVVDDNVENAKALAVFLSGLGHEIQIANDGLQAINAAKEHKPNVILLDIGLPIFDGYQVAKMVRGERCLQQTMIIAISAYGQEKDRLRAKAAGIDHHMLKPIDLDKLCNILVSYGAELPR